MNWRLCARKRETLPNINLLEYNFKLITLQFLSQTLFWGLVGWRYNYNLITPTPTFTQVERGWNIIDKIRHSKRDVSRVNENFCVAHFANWNCVQHDNDPSVRPQRSLIGIFRLYVINFDVVFLNEAGIKKIMSWSFTWGRFGWAFVAAFCQRKKA